jgi:two-component system sensor histidine kinase UhpB
MLITIFPVIYLFSSVVVYSYHSRLSEAAEELAERGRIVATALSEGLEYNVLSANLSGLNRSVSAVVQSDRNIHSVDIFDARRVAIVHVGASASAQTEEHFFEVPIKRQMVWVNLVGSNTASSGSSEIQEKSPAKISETLGYVRVTMSPNHMLAKQTQRFQIELAMALLALVVSAVLGLLLSKSLTNPLRKSIAALSEIQAGDYATTVVVTTGGEIGQLQSSINNMSLSLYQSKQNLEDKIQARTKDLVLSRNEALKSDAEKRKLIQKINSIVEDERKAIAIEIHDELNASLIAARLESQRIVQLVRKTETNEVPDKTLNEIQERAQSIIKLTLDLYANGRNLVRRLRPEVLDMLGLQGAIEEMLRYFNTDPSICQFTLHSSGDFSHLQSELAISGYRIIQEALSNVVKHAGASVVDILIELHEQENRLDIAINDNGCGFDPALVSSGLGITGMRERVYAFDGHFNLISAAGSGTRLTITLPLMRKDIIESDRK